MTAVVMQLLKHSSLLNWDGAMVEGTHWLVNISALEKYDRIGY